MSASSDVDPWLGRTLGDRYIIEELIGEGTTGVVYRARHTAMNKPVAVKLLHGVALGSRKAEMEERFRLEAQVYGQITHPNVCTATDFGVTDEGIRYLVMELLTGRSLFDVIVEHAPLDLQRAVSIATQIARGLTAVHGCDVVHRDLKPENVFLVTRGGQPDCVKLVDFGIARNMDSDAENGRLTEAGMIYGTPAYLAPEQARSMDVDGRADLYAVGVILFEMLAGRLPFERETAMALLQAHAHEDPPKLRSLRPDATEALESLVDALLAKDPSLRPKSASDLHHQLATVVQPGTPSLATPLGTDRFPAPSPPKKPRHWATIVVPVVAVLTAAAFLTTSGETSKSPTLNTSTPQAVPMDVRSAGSRGLPMAAGGAPAANASLEDLAAFEAEKRAFEERPGVRLALSQRQANPQLTLNELRRISAAEPKNPHAHYQLGMTFSDQGQGLEAVESWHTALQNEARYRHDQDLVQRLLDALLSKQPAEQAAVEHTLIKGGIITAGGDAISRLIREGTNLFQLGRLHNTAARAKLLAMMPALDRLLLEFRARPDCEVRTRILTGLQELGDRRALGVLKQSEHNRRGCGPGGNNDCIACIRPQLEKLILALERSGN